MDKFRKILFIAVITALAATVLSASVFACGSAVTDFAAIIKEGMKNLFVDLFWYLQEFISHVIQ